MFTCWPVSPKMSAMYMEWGVENICIILISDEIIQNMSFKHNIIHIIRQWLSHSVEYLEFWTQNPWQWWDMMKHCHDEHCECMAWLMDVMEQCESVWIFSFTQPSNFAIIIPCSNYSWCNMSESVIVLQHKW